MISRPINECHQNNIITSWTCHKCQNSANNSVWTVSNSRLILLNLNVNETLPEIMSNYVRHLQPTVQLPSTTDTPNNAIIQIIIDRRPTSPLIPLRRRRQLSSILRRLERRHLVQLRRPIVVDLMLMLRKTGTHMRRKRRRRALVLPWRIVSLWRVAHVRRRRRRVVLRRHLLRVCPRWLSRAWGRASCGVLRMTGVMLRMSWMLLLAHVGRGGPCCGGCCCWGWPG